MLNKYLLLFFFTFLGIHNNITSNLIGAKFVPISTNEIVIDIEADQAHKEKDLKEKAKKNLLSSLSAQDIALYEESFTQAPLKIKALVFGILKNEGYAQRFKNILLTGPSGSGKSTLAEAIAYKLGRKCLIIDAPSLLGHYRDQAAENVREVFRRITEDPDKPILIINEINALTDGHTSEHSDTKHTAMQLWALLDKYKNDKDFLLIATTNITKKMPHQLQTRFEGKTFLIDNPSVESRRRALDFCFQRLKVEKDETCTDAYLNELAVKAHNFSMRTIEALIDYSLLLFSIKNPEIDIKKASKEFLEQAYIELNKQKEEFWDFNEHTTDEERRHRENLAQHAKHSEEGKELQMQLAEWNMIFQAFMKSYEKSPTASWRDAIEQLNLAKSLVFPHKKPASKITLIPRGEGWFAASEKYIIEQNN